MSHPEGSTAYLNQEVLMNARYLVVVVNQFGLIERLECPGLQWQLDELCIGQELPETLRALLSSADGSNTPQFFPYVQLTADFNVDVHVLNREYKKQIILQDVSQGHGEEHRLQQKAHEVSLLLEQQAELNRMLEEKRAEAEEASKAKSRFIATMSHEFKSPISSIMAHAEALQGREPDEREPAAIQRASWYLLTLVENLLEQARMGEGEIRPDFSSVSVPKLLNDMSELFGIQAHSRGLALELDHSADARRVLADELRLRQVLINLLSNAIRYTRAGGVSLVCRRQGEAIEFLVTDTGRGIKEHDIERIFQPFTRVNPGGEGGAGLGLTISRQLVAAMNGELKVRSQAGEGTTFSFLLPMATADEQKNKEDLQDLSVLLVEDDDDIREMYGIWLEDWGVRARAAAGFESAIATFHEDPPDMVVTDLFLEDGNGVELLILLRETRPDVATVLCSGSDSIESFYGGEDSVIDCFVSKPVSASRLEAGMKSALRKKNKA